MDPCYHVANIDEIQSPALVVFRALLEENIDRMIRVAGRPERLRPHCKTHKIPQIARLQTARGILKHKCATLAEAEMLAQAGARDVFLAYNLVGPNIPRAARLLAEYPDLALSATVDHPGPLRALAGALRAAGRVMPLLLDVDVGMHRTGLPLGSDAERLYELLISTPGVAPGGLHAYDGQNQQTSLTERRAAVDAWWGPLLRFRDNLVARGWPVPRIVAAGTGTFPVLAEKSEPTLELSPGTVVFYDAGYRRKFPDLDFVPAALLLTRVISKPTSGRVTCDLGYKACASDPPAGQRLFFPDHPQAREVLQNEEHLVLEFPEADRLEPGDVLWAAPAHICPTTAMHQCVYVVEDGRVRGTWGVLARDRRLTV